VVMFYGFVPPCLEFLGFHVTEESLSGYLVTQRSKVLIEKQIVAQMAKKFPAFYGIICHGIADLNPINSSPPYFFKTNFILHTYSYSLD
jgi:hypothetical protein